MSDPVQVAKPFLKWAGGKRWLVSSHSYLLPRTFNRYIEPFLGSGAVFFSLRPKEAILSDSNERLIDCYLTVKADPDGVWRYLREFKRDHSDKFYYEIRNAAFRSPAKTAAQFIYLNRTCFNGIYRENLRGVFNVPRGTKDSVIFPDDDFNAISKLLKPVQLLSGDFAGSLQAAKKGDFVFVDPPYTVRHNSNGFVKYNQKIFDWKDQIRLRDEVKAAASRGAKLLITNANHPSIIELYDGIGSATALNRASVISGDSTSRGRYSELVITIGY
ncbi:DNA adenine methylase [Bradyrhizobium diazoefficiens]|uniref:Site-specific DNA-methyltransferase (adenine-specific) n=1 Tax=Bradyrhizobium diazoefficiens TaxID=1355477 RepID=A0A809Y7M3_9BRAD|nr:site-specific DNA-methyltransferase (adenine-specific) [Bradyrhizobium diazoefficiens]BCF21166.1 site-specific DNA-methyltransferase (adenine-specific) [Bradyrhizobium diazoefficiens]